MTKRFMVGALMLPLCSCAGGIGGKAQQYLSSQYSGKFTITGVERIAAAGTAGAAAPQGAG